jgi:hypothetical protein
VVRAEWHCPKGKELDVFGSHSRLKIIRLIRVIFDSCIEVFDGTHAKVHDFSLAVRLAR